MDKKEEISAKLTSVHDNNELDVKIVSFEWTSSTGIMSATKMNHCNKEDLRFEVLKGISIKDAIERECKLASAK